MLFRSHPTNVLETGWDILFFWVARMILTTTYVTGEVPFRDVYLHGMVRAEDGKKMSKSRPESIIDPLTVINEYGTDALRMALIMGVSPGNDQNWATSKVEANRNFANKLWNIARYIEGSLGEQLNLDAIPQPESLADNWIIGNLKSAIESTHRNLADYRFSEAYNTLYHLIWDDVADWYIEASKTTQNASVLNYTLATILKLLHPFAPFVTEAIWQQLSKGDSLLSTQPWPAKAEFDYDKAKDFVAIQSIVTGVRQIRTELKLQKGTLGHTNDQFITDNTELIKLLGKLDRVEAMDAREGLTITGTNHDCWYVIDAETAKKYVQSLKDDQANLQSQINRLNERLANKNYVEKAPAELITQTREELASAQKELDKVFSQIENFNS